MEGSSGSSQLGVTQATPVSKISMVSLTKHPDFTSTFHRIGHANFEFINSVFINKTVGWAVR